MIVLDASVALALCFEDESSPYADRVALALESDRAVVPPIWALEVSNALVAAERRGRLGPDELPRLTELLAALPIEVEPVSLRQALGPVADVARSRGLSVYDAAYLELARRLELPLATHDRALRQAAIAAGVALFA